MFTHRLFHLLMMIALLTITACSSQPAATPDPTATLAPTEPPLPTATPDSKLVLVGSWITTVTKEDLVGVRPEFPPEHLCENAGTFEWTFNADGTFTIDQTALPDCPTPANPHIEDVWLVEGNLFTIAKGTPDQDIYEWSVNGDQLVFVHVSGECPPCEAINTANPWTRVE
jgi:hypothetical protein